MGNLFTRRLSFLQSIHNIRNTNQQQQITMEISPCTLKFLLIHFEMALRDDVRRNGNFSFANDSTPKRSSKNKTHNQQIQDGTIESLDDPLGKYLSWWTKNETDLRSTVTMRMLLSFTSGFGGGHPGEEMNTRQAREWRARNSPVQNVYLDAGDATSGEVVECAKSIYENVKLIGTPGKVYSYV